MNHKVLILSLILSIQTLFPAEIYNPDFKNITNENGLPNNTVRSITKDQDGFMWFGTYDGLCRYDGLSIKTFKKTGNSSDAFHNHISALYCNSDNQLFVGTRKGLFIFNKINQSFIPVNYQNFTTQVSKQSSVEITAIIGNNDKVFIATLGEGLLEYDNRKKSCTQVNLWNNESNLYIHSLAFTDDNNQSIVLGVDDKGIYKYNYKSKNISLITNKVNHTLSILDSNNKLYIGTNNGLLTFEAGVLMEAQSQSEFRSPVQFLKKDQKGVIWVGTENKGLLLIAPNNNIQHISAGYKSSMLTSEGLYCMYTDESNYVWLGTMRGGIDVWNLKLKEFQSRKNYLADNPASNFINCFLEISPNIIWLGTDGGGIQQYNQLTDKFEQSPTARKINQTIGNTVISIKKDNAGNIWLGTYGSGLFKYNPGKQTIKQYTNKNSNLTSNNIWCMYTDRKENLWIGSISSGGLFRYRYSEDNFEKINIDADNVLTLNEDNQRRLIIGNYSGVTIFNPKNNKIQHFDTNIPVRAVHQDKNNNLWIGTEGSGLLNLNVNSSKITPANHLLDYLKESSIMSIVEDSRNNLWISTSNGLFRYHYPDNQLTAYNKNDGLQDKQFNYSSFLKTSNNYLYFGGINGFTMFQPERISIQSSSCPFHITDISIHNASIYSDKERYGDIIEQFAQNKIKLKYEDAYLRFDFIAISYNNPEKIIYSYMLEGLDKTWILAGSNHSANYSGLAPGNYVFKLKYSTQPYQWKEDQIIELKVTVSPPFYLTWWAYFIYFTLSSIIIYAIIYVQKRQNRLKHELLLSDMKEEQAIQAQQMREQFFINISHELRTPLTLIIPPIKDCLMTNPYKPITKNELQTVYNNANRLLLLINKLLLFRKNEMQKDQLRLTTLDFIDFTRKIFHNFSQIANIHNINYLYNAPKEAVYFKIDVDKMEIILYNLLSNAFKYTPEHGTIALEIAIANKQLSLSIKDSGCGISQEELDHIFYRFYSSNKYSGIGIGLSLVKDYVELLNGTLKIDTKINSGSTFCITFTMDDNPNQKEDIIDSASEYLPSKNMLELVKIDTLLSINKHSDENQEGSIVKLPKVLIVEDNPEIMEYIKRIISQTQQYEILLAENGKVALKIAKKHLPDVILSDIHMPEMNGLELCSAIKNDNETNHIYFIMITADLLDDTELKGIQLGADEYITKPFDKTKLLNKLKTIFNYQQKIRTYFNQRVTLGIGAQDKEGLNTNYAFVDKCINIVKENYNSDEFSPLTLAQQMNMSQSAMYKKIKLCTGKSINEFIRTIKLTIASNLIENSNLTINEIATDVGINDIKYFRDCFKKQFGVTPSEYRKSVEVKKS